MTKNRTVIMILDSLGTQKNDRAAEAFRQAKLLNTLGHKVVIAPFTYRKKQYYTFLLQKIKKGLWNTILEKQPNQLKEFKSQTNDALTDIQVANSLATKEETYKYHLLGNWIDTLDNRYDHPVFINWDRHYDTLFFNRAYIHNDVVCVAAIKGHLLSKKGTPKSIIQKLAKRGDAFAAFMVENEVNNRFVSGYFGIRKNSFIIPSNSEEWTVAMNNIKTCEMRRGFNYNEVPTVTRMLLRKKQDIEDRKQSFTVYQMELTVDITDASMQFYLLTPLSDVSFENAKENSFVFEPLSIENESNNYIMEFKVPKKANNSEIQTPWRLEVQYERNVCLYNIESFKIEQGEQESE